MKVGDLVFIQRRWGFPLLAEVIRVFGNGRVYVKMARDFQKKNVGSEDLVAPEHIHSEYMDYIRDAFPEWSEYEKRINNDQNQRNLDQT